MSPQVLPPRAIPVTLSDLPPALSPARPCTPTMLHVCPFKGCTKGFSKKYNLKAHLRLHTGATPFSCPRLDCDKKFKWRSSLSSHSVWHQRQETGEEQSDSKSLVSGTGGAVVESGSPEPRDHRSSKSTKSTKQSKSSKISKPLGDRKPSSAKKQKQRAAGSGKAGVASSPSRQISLKSEALLPSEMFIPSPSDTAGHVSVGPAMSLPAFDRHPQTLQKRTSKSAVRRRPASRPTQATTQSSMSASTCAVLQADSCQGDIFASGSSVQSFMTLSIDEAQSELSTAGHVTSGPPSMCEARRCFPDMGTTFSAVKREHMMSASPMSSALLSAPPVLVSSGLDAACDATALMSGTGGVCDFPVVGVEYEADPGSPVTTTDENGVFQLGPVLNDDFDGDLPFLGGTSVGDLQSLPLCGLGAFELDMPLEYEL